MSRLLVVPAASRAARRLDRLLGLIGHGRFLREHLPSAANSFGSTLNIDRKYENFKMADKHSRSTRTPLATVEAMKMENVLRAERKATVAKINVAPGASLAVDEVIKEFE